MEDRRAANAAKVRALTTGLAVAGVVGTGVLGGIAYAQDHQDGSGTSATTDADSTNGGSSSTATSSDDSWNSGGSTTTWPQLSAGNSVPSHSRSGGS